MTSNRTKAVTLHGLLVALALILSYLEARIPVFFAIPGMKLGLTNVVVLVALYCLGTRSAIGINLLRIVLVSMLFGNAMSLAYSLAGGLLSGAVMILLKKTKKLSIVTVSIAGGIAHNIGQILTAMVLLQTAALGWYLLVLWFTGLASGAVIGIIGGELCRRLKKYWNWESEHEKRKISAAAFGSSIAFICLRKRWLFRGECKHRVGEQREYGNSSCGNRGHRDIDSGDHGCGDFGHRRDCLGHQ